MNELIFILKINILILYGIYYFNGMLWLYKIFIYAIYNYILLIDLL